MNYKNKAVAEYMRKVEQKRLELQEDFCKLSIQDQINVAREIKRLFGIDITMFMANTNNKR